MPADTLTLSSRPKPALSTTSDAVSVASTPAPATETDQAPVASPTEPAVNSDSAAATAETSETSATSNETTGDESAANAEKAKPAKGVQRRIDELTRQRGDAERLANEQSKRLDQALKLIERLAGDPAESARADVDQADPKPQRKDFDDPDTYTESLASWSGRQAVKSYQMEQQQHQQQSKAQEDFQKVTKSWDEGRNKALEKYPDFIEVVENPTLNIPEFVSFAIAHHANGHEIAYHLGKHPAEADRIASLLPYQAMMEIGAIGVKLGTQTAPISKAPAPAKPLQGSRSEASGTTPENDPGYMDRRLAELRNKKR